MGGAIRSLRLGVGMIVMLVAVGLATVVACKNQTRGAGNPNPNINFRVVDEQGAPVKAFDAQIHTPDNTESTVWMPGSAGAFQLRKPFPQAAAFYVMVRSDNYVSAITHFTGASREEMLRGEGQIALRRGQDVTLQFRLPEGMTWPTDEMPQLYFEELRDNVRSMWDTRNRESYGSRLPDFDMLKVRVESPGQFRFRLAADTPPFYVGIYAAGFLRYFETGPFTLADFKDGKIEIELPRPAAVEVHFAAPAAAREQDANEEFLLQLTSIPPGTRNRRVSVASQTSDSDSAVLRLADLAPGNYEAAVLRVPKSAAALPPQRPVNRREYRVTKAVTLSAGDVENVDFQFTPFDPSSFRGDTAVTLLITTPDGKPAPVRDVKVNYEGGEHGVLLVHSGKLPATGTLQLENLRAEDPKAQGSGRYSLEFDGQRVGTFKVAGGKKAQSFEFHAVPGPGDMAPAVAMQDVDSGMPVDLRDLRGKVIVLEFWSTGCGPCQAAMKNFNDLANEGRSAWKDRVVFATLSIDDTAEQAARHVRQRGWTGLRHFWSGAGEETQWESPAAKAFSLSSMPTLILINAQGQIVWRGHPSDTRDGLSLKSRVDAILD